MNNKIAEMWIAIAILCISAYWVSMVSQMIYDPH